MATAGGLIFTAAALDPHLHAFDADTGKELWTVELPASAQSTPMTYRVAGQAVHRDLRGRPRQDEEQDGRFGGGVPAGASN